MLLEEPLGFIREYIEKINEAIEEKQPGEGLSKRQRMWLGFCISGILLTNSVCWARFERISLGKLSIAAISWMFRKANIKWEELQKESVRKIVREYGVKEGAVIADDTDNERSKNTKQIGKVHKLRDKLSGGYLKGQSLVFLVLVTEKITIPISFAFYEPDPALVAWRKEKRQLKREGKTCRAKPERDMKRYPTKQEIALRLLKDFEQDYAVKIKCVLADAFYGSAAFMEEASKLWGGVQVISQLRCSQHTKIQGRRRSIEDYFASYPGIMRTLTIRGAKEQTVIAGGGRLWVKAHQQKRWVIAIKYADEQDYRYLVASDMSWRMTDVIQGYTLRWLVEVFFADWKAHEGWCELAKQPGVEGSCRGVILSLLTDHSLFFHPAQKASLENKLPMVTVGSLRAHIHFEAITQFCQKLICHPQPEEVLSQCVKQMGQVIKLQPSKKHMHTRDWGRLEPTASLKYMMAA